MVKKRGRKKKFPEVYSIIIRYLILILVAIPNFWIFYFVFTPLTVSVVYFLLNLFFNTSLIKDVIFLSGNFSIEIIRACIAGSAYYLLFILNLSVPKIEFKKRIKMILFSFLSFFILNVLRIFLLSIMYIKSISWFDIAHLVFWYSVSIIFVIAIWFAEVKIFKIKEIPFYSDLKTLFEKTKIKKKS
jgi:exosortase/archaeosortase family protein